MAKKYLDYDGLLYFWQKIKAIFVSDVTYNSTSRKIQKTKNGSASDVVTLSTVATSGSYNDLSSKPTIPSAGTGSSYPAMDGTRSLGSNAGFARVDHVHPTDTSRAPLASPAFTGTPTAPTASTGTSTTQIATTEFVANTVGAMTAGVSSVNGYTGAVTLDANDIGFAPGLDDSWTVSSVADALDDLHDKKVDAVSGKGLSTNDYTTAEKNKLAGIASGAEVNQNAFSNVKVGSTTVAADTKTDTLELVAGTDISLTPDATNDKVTIAFNGTIPSGADEIYYTGSSTILQEANNVEQALDILGDEVLDRVPDARKVNGKALSADITINGEEVPFSSSNNTSVSQTISNFMAEVASNYMLAEKRGAANGVCPLNASSKIDSTYLPSYVDDVIEAYPRSGQTELSSTWLATGSASGTVITPEAGKIYVLMADSTSYSANSQFRWGGSAYVKMNDGGVSSITNSEIDTIVAA